MSHPLTEADTLAWDKTIRTIAAHWAKAWAYHQDQAPLIDDLTAEGWIALLEHGVDAPYLGKRITAAIQDALCKWLYGVTYGQAPRHLRQQLPLSAAAQVPSPARPVADTALDRVALEEVWVISPDRAQKVLVMMAEAGQRQLDPADYRPHGLTKHTVHDDRVRLTAAAQRVLGEAS
jgi:hypothetical protein